MTIPSGFIRLTPSKYEGLLKGGKSLSESNPDLVYRYIFFSDFEKTDFFEMDRAGYELLYILDPGRSERLDAMYSTPYPGITSLLCGDDFEPCPLRLGKLPVRKIPFDTLDHSITDFNKITQDQLTALTMTNEHLSEVFLDDINVKKVGETHWPFLCRLSNFIRHVVQKNWVVLTY